MPFPNTSTQIQPGEVKNPKGRPMRPSAQVLQKILDDTPFEKLPPRIQKKLMADYGGAQIKQAMAYAMIELVLDKGKGAVSAYTAQYNRLEGMPTQPVEDVTIQQAMGEGELSRRLVGFLMELLKSRQGNGVTPPQPSNQGEPTNEHQTPRGGDGTGSPADVGERR